MASLVSTQRGAGMAVVSHYNVAPVVDIFGRRDGTRFGSVAADINKIMTRLASNCHAALHIVVRGQVQTMRASYVGLLSGLAFSIVLVYLLIVVNFQSWLDPFIMISALPAALAGIAWFLFITHTTLSVPALMGAIMCNGRRNVKQHPGSELCYGKNGAGKRFHQRRTGGGFHALSARPDDCSAMIIGMVPMALGLGDGGEQNAPLGRAVIGGLLFATVSTLFFVPAFF